MLYNIQNLARISSKYVLQRLKYCTKCNILLLFIRTMVEMLYVMQYSSPHSRSELGQGVISSGLRTSSIAKVRRLLFHTFSEIAPSRWEFYCYARDVLYCLYARRGKFSFPPSMLILSTILSSTRRQVQAHRSTPPPNPFFVPEKARHFSSNSAIFGSRILVSSS